VNRTSLNIIFLHPQMTTGISSSQATTVVESLYLPASPVIHPQLYLLDRGFTRPIVIRSAGGLELDGGQGVLSAVDKAQVRLTHKVDRSSIMFQSAIPIVG